MTAAEGPSRSQNVNSDSIRRTDDVYQLTGGVTGGVAEVREGIGAFVGVTVGVQLRRLRAATAALTTIDWTAHDEPY